MLAQAVTRFDAIFARALADGLLQPDPTLNLGTPEIDPALLRLIERTKKEAGYPTQETVIV